ncbi:MAG: DUF1795 domain-containing protein [Oscillospiraceae bacterium]|nr:DUF1795 domain-containing protein [Oscillospiraceae bacterium]
MKRLFVALLALFLVVGLTACVETPEPAETPPPPIETPVPAETPVPLETPEPEEPAEDDGNGTLFAGAGWSMEIADGWTVMEEIGVHALFAPGETGSNINVVVEHIQGMSLVDYVDASLDMLAAFFEEFELIREEGISINGKDGIFIAYTSDFPGVHTMYQFIVEADGIAYVITYTRMDETDYLDDVLDMLHTFTVSEALFAGNDWSMEIVTGWAVMEVAGLTVLTAPGGSGSNINVVTESTQGMSLDDYTDATLDMLASFFEEFELVIDEHISINGKNGIFIAYTSAFPGVHTTYQFIIEVGGMAYIITYTRMDETDYLDDVLDMVETFTVVR